LTIADETGVYCRYWTAFI